MVSPGAYILFQGHLPHFFQGSFFPETQGSRICFFEKKDGCKEWKRDQPLELIGVRQFQGTHLPSNWWLGWVVWMVSPWFPPGFLLASPCFPLVYLKGLGLTAGLLRCSEHGALSSPAGAGWRPKLC